MREKLLELGFKEIPHFTIQNALIYDLGRGRHLSFGNIGNPNEMLWLCQLSHIDKRVITDLICIRNFDYDGYTSLEDIKAIINSFKPNKSNELQTSNRVSSK